MDILEGGPWSRPFLSLFKCLPLLSEPLYKLHLVPAMVSPKTVVVGPTLTLSLSCCHFCLLSCLSLAGPWPLEYLTYVFLCGSRRAPVLCSRLGRAELIDVFGWKNVLVLSSSAVRTQDQCLHSLISSGESGTNRPPGPATLGHHVGRVMKHYFQDAKSLVLSSGAPALTLTPTAVIPTSHSGKARRGEGERGKGREQPLYDSSQIYVRSRATDGCRVPD